MRMLYNSGVMKLIGSWRFTHCASLVAAALLLCFGALLSWTTTEPKVAASFAMADPPYFAVPTEETENSDKDPVNAGLLTALLLTFYGVMSGWPLANSRGHQAFYSSVVAHCLAFDLRQDPPSLGVFRM
jgi:hypothetical protein